MIELDLNLLSKTVQGLCGHISEKICSKHFRRNKNVKCSACGDTNGIECQLVLDQGESYFDPGRYRQLVNKLNYLIVTCPNIVFVTNVISQF